MSMSAFAQPIFIDADGERKPLQQVRFKSEGRYDISEKWLQKELYASPQSLPVREIDPHIGPLISICMEIETGSGPADILYVTATGQVVLVELKLWRNPESRREVVGQILDYANNLTRWTFENLSAEVEMASKGGPGHLMRCVRNACPEVDEVAFVDGINRCLSTGDFLLLIVGDGIRSGAESLVSFLEKYGHLKFGLALIEVAIYDLPGKGKLLQPRVLAKTEVLHRKLLLGPDGPMRFEEVAQAEDAASTKNRLLREWFTKFWGEFLARLQLEDISRMPVQPSSSTNQAIQMPPGGGKAWVSAYVAQSVRKAGVYFTFLKTYDRASELYELLKSDSEAIEREVGVELRWTRDDEKDYLSVPDILFKELTSQEERDRVTTHLAEMTQRLVGVLQPRLEALVKS